VRGGGDAHEHHNNQQQHQPTTNNNTTNRATELYLDVNDMGDEGAAAFARVLATNSTLRYLNPPPPPPIMRHTISHTFPTTRDYSALTLASNDIGDDGAAALAEALISNPNSALQMYASFPSPPPL
jgi:hypothetical protein